MPMSEPKRLMSCEIDARQRRSAGHDNLGFAALLYLPRKNLARILDHRASLCRQYASYSAAYCEEAVLVLVLVAEAAKALAFVRAKPAQPGAANGL